MTRRLMLAAFITVAAFPLQVLAQGHEAPGTVTVAAADHAMLKDEGNGITTPAAASQDDAAALTAWLGTYDAAFNAKDLEKLATFYHPDVTVYEGAGINTGWADYRDRHLGPELKAFQNLQFAHSETKVTVLPGGQSAYATSRYTLKAKMGERDIDSEGLATYVLLKGANGAWQIRHSHTSGRARRPGA